MNVEARAIVSSKVFIQKAECNIFDYLNVLLVLRYYFIQNKALGDQDELNASIGLAREYAQQSRNGLEEKLIDIQVSEYLSVNEYYINNSKSEKKIDYICLWL